MKRKTGVKSSGGSSAGPDIDQIEQLLKTMAEHNLEEFEYSRGDLRIRLKKPSAGTVLTAARPTALPEIIVAGASSSSAASSAAAASSSPEPRSTEDLHLVKSPIVGTYYDAPAPGAAPFVKVGDAVEPGQVLCIIESMKLMNEIEADVSGEVVKRLVANGQPIEYGQPLFSIRPHSAAA